MYTRFILLAVITMFHFGCALSEEKVSISYNSNVAHADVVGAENVTLVITAVDGRTSNRSVISRKINGYGVEMAAIRSNQDITLIVRNALRAEYLGRGFEVEEQGVPLVATITKFYNQYENGLFSGTSNAEVRVDVSIANGADSVFEKSYTGVHSDGVMIADGVNAKAALDAALAKVISKIVNDRALHNALIHYRANGTTVPLADLTS